MPDLILPPRLQPGATIAVVSPAWGGLGVLHDRAARGIAALESLGYQVQVMPHARGTADGVRDWVSASPGERVADLHAAFADPQVGMVLSAIGGQHSAHILPHLDFDLIAANPKPFSGYSDITSVHFAIHAMTGMVTFYGPALLPEFGEVGGPDKEVVSHVQTVVGKPEPAGPLPVIDWQATEDRRTSDAEGRPRVRERGEPRTALRPGTGSGPLLAACLPSARALIGTPWQPDYEGRILVLEPPEAPYNPEEADQDLTHLRNAGLLDNLAGLAIGRTEGWSARAIEQFHVCVGEAVTGTSYPVLAGVEVAHAAPLLTLPLGVSATITGTGLIIDQAAVR